MFDLTLMAARSIASDVVAESDVEYNAADAYVRADKATAAKVLYTN
jgi:hypothetical protein